MEGPSIHNLVEDLEPLREQTIEEVRGNAKQPLAELEGRTITRLEPVKKRVVVGDESAAAAVHFLMYGSHRWNERRSDQEVRLGLTCTEDEWNTYNTSVKIWVGDELDANLDPTGDVLRDEWDDERAWGALEEREDPVADVLLDQEIFGGVGNIVKNEALWRARVFPKAAARDLPDAHRQAVFEETIEYMRAWREQGSESPPDGGLDIYRAGACPVCGGDVTQEEIGTFDRVTYWCPDCQTAGALG
jgi:endonuclease-8